MVLAFGIASMYIGIFENRKRTAAFMMDYALENTRITDTQNNHSLTSYVYSFTTFSETLMAQKVTVHQLNELIPSYLTVFRFEKTTITNYLFIFIYF